MCFGSRVTSKASVAACLHAKGQLERFDAGLEGGVFGPRLLMPAVESGQQVELPPLSRFGQRTIADVVDQLVDAGVPRVDVRSLKAARQKGRPPIRDVGNRQSRAHGDKTGQVLVFRPHAVQAATTRSSAARAARPPYSSAASTARDWACCNTSSGRCTYRRRAGPSCRRFPRIPGRFSRNAGIETESREPPRSDVRCSGCRRGFCGRSTS